MGPPGMTDDRLYFRGRVVRAVHLHEEGNRCVLIESRAVQLRNLGIVLGFLILILGVFSGVWKSSGLQGPDLVGWVLLGCLIGVPLLLGALWSGLNRRVEIDLNLATCTAQRRWLMLPYWSRTRSLQEGVVRVRPVVYRRLEMTHRIGALGCFLLLLGPIAILVEGIMMLASIRRFETWVTGLVFVAADGSRTSVLMPTVPGVLKPMEEAGFVEPIE